MRMPSIRTSRVIEAPAERVWDLLVDTRRWSEWGTTVRDVDFPDRYITAGSRGRVRTVLGLWVPFHITQCAPPKYWAWSIAGIAATGHAVEPLGNSACRLTFTVPLYAAPYVLLCIPAIRRIARLAERKEALQ